MKILLICITLLSISFNAFSEQREIDNTYFGAVICPQMKNSQHPIANRHTIYNFHKCLGHSKDKTEEYGNQELKLHNSGFIPLKTYDYYVVFSNSTDEFGNIFSEIQLPKFYNHWESCPVDFTHNMPSIYPCKSYQVNASCNKYLDNLEKHNLITNARKRRFKRANSSLERTEALKRPFST